MTRLGSTRALLVRITAVAFTVAAAGCAVAAPVGSRGSVSAKIGYCQDCHGPSGQGFYGYYPIPRLAGQQPQYIRNQLEAFIKHERTNNIMFNVAHVLSPAMTEALAARFHAFDPPPLGGGAMALAAKGKEIFQDGLPNSNIAACAACHGPDAHGHDQVPRLAGQLAAYVVRQLSVWETERGRETLLHGPSATMLPIAHSLNKRQMEEVAAYVSGLR
jgi:cytochrome c553